MYGQGTRGDFEELQCSQQQPCNYTVITYYSIEEANINNRREMMDFATDNKRLVPCGRAVCAIPIVSRMARDLQDMKRKGIYPTTEKVERAIDHQLMLCNANTDKKTKKIINEERHKHLNRLFRIYGECYQTLLDRHIRTKEIADFIVVFVEYVLKNYEKVELIKKIYRLVLTVDPFSHILNKCARIYPVIKDKNPVNVLKTVVDDFVKKNTPPSSMNNID